MLAFQLRSEHHLAWSILDAAHCVGRIAEEIENDLLQLHSVPVNSRQPLAKFMLQIYAVFLKLAG